MMNDLDRLKILEKILLNTRIETVENIGVLANDIESLRNMLDDVSEEFSNSFAKLWAGLEVLVVRHQEGGTELSQHEVENLEELKRNFQRQTEREIADRAGH